MARHLLLAQGMHLYVEWKLMEAKIHKHLFSLFFVIFGDGYVTVVACGVPVGGLGVRGPLGCFMGWLDTICCPIKSIHVSKRTM